MTKTLGGGIQQKLRKYVCERYSGGRYLIETQEEGI
jgi:hypothetical protein